MGLQSKSVRQVGLRFHPGLSSVFAASMLVAPVGQASSSASCGSCSSFSDLCHAVLAARFDPFYAKTAFQQFLTQLKFTKRIEAWVPPFTFWSIWATFEMCRKPALQGQLSRFWSILTKSGFACISRLSGSVFEQFFAIYFCRIFSLFLGKFFVFGFFGQFSEQLFWANFFVFGFFGQFSSPLFIKEYSLYM